MAWFRLASQPPFFWHCLYSKTSIINTSVFIIDVLCAPKRDTHRTLYLKIVYMDKNTSPIIPKPMSSKQIKQFYSFLCDCSEALRKILKLQQGQE